MALKKWGMERFAMVFAVAFMATCLTIWMYSSKNKEVKIGRVIDGDTLLLKSGEKIRLLGIDAPDIGEEGSEKAGVILEQMINNKRTWIEGDRYKKDMYGRKLGWLWMGCESKPEFMPDSYMEDKYLANRGARMERTAEENPIGCKSGLLVNEELLRMGLVKMYFDEYDGELKYEERLKTVFR